MSHINHIIFMGVTDEEYEELLSCGCVRVAEYRKDRVIFRTSDVTREFGILISGKIHIENIDLWGNRIILHNVGVGGSFAETYAFCNVPVMVNATAEADCKVLMVNLDVLFSESTKGKTWREKLVYNLLSFSANKNLVLTDRIFCISSKGIRTKVMTYLSAEAVRAGSKQFTIPFDRQQMADYLNVERSALSKELGRMRKEGLIDFCKNKFTLTGFNKDN